MYQFIIPVVSSFIVSFFMDAKFFKPGSSDIVTLLSIIGGGIFTTLILNITILNPMTVVYSNRIDKYCKAVKEQVKFLFVTFLISIFGAGIIVVAEIFEWYSVNTYICGVKFKVGIFNIFILMAIFLLTFRIPLIYKSIQELLSLHNNSVSNEVKRNAKETGKRQAAEIENLPPV